MSTENYKKLNARLVQKSDTSANWNTASTAANPFIPLNGELIVYTDLNKVKIGNGTDVVGDLPFLEAESGVQSITYTLTKNGSTLALNGSDGSSTNVQIIDYGMTLPSTGENGQIFLLKA